MITKICLSTRKPS